MVAITVIRGTGDSQGDDIIDPLLASTTAAIHRGLAELNQHASNLQEINLQIVFRPGIEIGQLVAIQDSLQGVEWRGRVVAIRHSSSGIQVTTKLTIERPS